MKSPVVEKLERDKFFDFYASRDAYEARDKHIFLDVDFRDSENITKI